MAERDVEIVAFNDTGRLKLALMEVERLRAREAELVEALTGAKLDAGAVAAKLDVWMRFTVDGDVIREHSYVGAPRVWANDFHLPPGAYEVVRTSCATPASTPQEDEHGE